MIASENHSPTQLGSKPRYSVPESLELLGVSRWFFYDRVKNGQYRIIKDGGRTFMTHEQLLDAAQGDGAPA